MFNVVEHDRVTECGAAPGPARRSAARTRPPPRSSAARAWSTPSMEPKELQRAAPGGAPGRPRAMLIARYARRCAPCSGARVRRGPSPLPDNRAGRGRVAASSSGREAPGRSRVGGGSGSRSGAVSMGRQWVGRVKSLEMFGWYADTTVPSTQVRVSASRAAKAVRTRASASTSSAYICPVFCPHSQPEPPQLTRRATTDTQITVGPHRSQPCPLSSPAVRGAHTLSASCKGRFSPPSVGL